MPTQAELEQSTFFQNKYAEQLAVFFNDFATKKFSSSCWLCFVMLRQKIRKKMFWKDFKKCQNCHFCPPTQTRLENHMVKAGQEGLSG